MVANGTIRHLADDFDKTGERIALGLKLNLLILRAGFLLRGILTRVLKLVGMGRLVAFLKYAYLMNHSQHDALYRDREQFCEHVSRKWRDTKIDVLVTPAFPSVTFKYELADDMGNMLDYLNLWSVT